MKGQIGRGIGTIAIMAGVVGLGYVTKDGCTAAFCGVICIAIIWANAD